MAKTVNRKAMVAHDPLAARFGRSSDTESDALTAPDPASFSAPETASVTALRPERSSTTIDFERADYQRLKKMAKSRGLTVRGYVRSATLDRLRDDERR